MYAQSENWKKLIETENLPLFVIGDFNQTRFNNQGYGTARVREILTNLLIETDLECVTEIDFSEKYLTEDPIKKKIRNNIDHISSFGEDGHSNDDYIVAVNYLRTFLSELLDRHSGK